MTSIVIPSSGRAGLIERTLAAIARQTGAEKIEVVIVDDTLDQSLAQRVGCASDGIEVRVVRGPRQGPGAARNAGAQAARGELLIFIDDDCSPAPQWLNAYESEGARRPMALLAGPISDGLPDNRWSQAYHTILDYLYEVHLTDSAPQSLASSLSRLPFATSANFAINRAAFLRAGGFDASLGLAAEDRAFSALWQQSGGSIERVPEARVIDHHPLTLQSYFAQQFRYGRGGYQFRRWLEKRYGAPSRIEAPSFYVRLLMRAARQERRRAFVFMAVLLGQAAVACGLLYEMSTTSRSARQNP